MIFIRPHQDGIEGTQHLLFSIGCFSRLRELRKRLAAEDGVPIYAVFTNEQLAAMARNRTGSLDELAAIDGVGKARVERHGEAFLALIREQPPLQEQPQLNGDLNGA